MSIGKKKRALVFARKNVIEDEKGKKTLIFLMEYKLVKD